uniref:(northern house mosquito) hypothetical protein n=1 Tax=Culex pipiens TaxID=7175 RepID=A0A8D8I2A8_CULPI
MMSPMSTIRMVALLALARSADVGAFPVERIGSTRFSSDLLFEGSAAAEGFGVDAAIGLDSALAAGVCTDLPGNPCLDLSNAGMLIDFVREDFTESGSFLPRAEAGDSLAGATFPAELFCGVDAAEPLSDGKLDRVVRRAGSSSSTSSTPLLSLSSESTVIDSFAFFTGRPGCGFASTSALRFKPAATGGVALPGTFFGSGEICFATSGLLRAVFRPNTGFVSRLIPTI